MVTQFDREYVADIMAGAEDYFTAQLLRLCAKADRGNLEKMRQAWPDVVELYEQWSRGELPVQQ